MIFNFKSFQLNKCHSAYYVQSTVLACYLPPAPVSIFRCRPLKKPIIACHLILRALRIMNHVFQKKLKTFMLQKDIFK